MKKILLIISVLAVVVSVSFAECCSCGSDNCSNDGCSSCSTVECQK